MYNDTFQPLEDLLVEAKNRAQVVLESYAVGQVGQVNAHYLHSDICKALAHLRALKTMNV